MNNNQATLQKIEQMKFYGMARAFTNTMETGVKNQFTADELLSHLVDAEWDDRHNRKLTRLLKGARFRYKASFEEINFRRLHRPWRTLFEPLLLCDQFIYCLTMKLDGTGSVW